VNGLRRLPWMKIILVIVVLAFVAPLILTAAATAIPS
jgi:hypothetical protein